MRDHCWPAWSSWLALTAVHRQDQDGQGHAGRALRTRARPSSWASTSTRTISMTFAIGSALAAIAGRAAVLRLPHPAAHHRLHAGHQGLHRRRVRRHRLHPRRHAGRHACWASSRSLPRPTSPPSCRDAIVFAVLIVVLLVKPAGLLGKHDARESVRWHHETFSEMEP